MEINAVTIKNFRKKYRITQARLAEILGVSHRTIQNYEDGNVIPKSKLKMLRKIFDAYKAGSVEKEFNFQETYKLIKNVLDKVNNNQHLEDIMNPDIMKILDEIPKEHIIAYMTYREEEFKKVNLYNLFIKDKIKDGVIEELVKRIKN